MCFCLFVYLCAAAVRVLGKGQQCEKEMIAYLSKGYTFTGSNSGAKYTHTIERSHVDHMNSAFHLVNISTTLIMFTYMYISPLNRILHPGLGSTH